MRRERIIKGCIGEYDKKGDDPILCIIQYPSEVLVAGFNTSEFNKFFYIGPTEVPMLNFRSSKKSVKASQTG